MSPKTKALCAALVVAASALVLVATKTPVFGGNQAGPSKATVQERPLVKVASAEARDLPVAVGAHGHVVALNQVDVRPQVGGAIRGVHFREGGEVRAGQLMFTIDASDVAAQLERALAGAAQIEAQVDDAERDLARTRQLATSRFYSTSAVDTSASKLESLQAQYKAAQAEVASIRVLLDRTRITAPMSGITGALSVHPGSLAQVTSSLPLVTIVQVDPIAVEFTLPESLLSRVLTARSAGAVRIALQSPEGDRVPGDLVFVNNTVNTDSGTITLKAAFPNPHGTLWPGAYVDLTVEAGVSAGSIGLPPQAVLDGPQGRFVYALDAAEKVQVRPIELLRLQDQLAVVTGLKAGERVVVEGQQRLKPGVAVRIDTGNGPMPAGAIPPSKATP
jgi:RND family efflux transporter MFP subunit